MNVSRETSERLTEYLNLLTTWSAKINLVAPNTIGSAWERHIQDSLQLIDLRPAPGNQWLDLGSGGGLPGLVIAIAAPWQRTRFTLVESDARKATFLRRAASALSLTNVEVVTERIEALTPQNAPTISARALAPLPSLMSYVARHLASNGVALLPKGRNWESEVRDARRNWSFNLTPHPSRTQAEAAVLEISDIHAS